MSDFDAKKLLAQSIPKVVQALGDCTYDQLLELERAEKASSTARPNLLVPLQAEIAARVEACPGLKLSDESVDRIAMARFQHGPSNDPEPSEDDRATMRAMVREDISMAPGSGDENASVVQFIVSLLLEIEQLHAQIAGAPGEVVPEGQMAKGETKPENEFAKIADLAFCDADGEVQFAIKPKNGELTLEGRKAVFGRKVTLARDKKPVAVSQVVARDTTGLPVARVTWPVPLVGGGGKLAEFPARHIAIVL